MAFDLVVSCTISSGRGRARPSLAALHGDGEVRGGRGNPGHRPGRRLLPRGCGRTALPGRARGPLLREHRLRLRRGDGRGRGGADARAAVRDQLDIRPSALYRARRRGRGTRARRPQPRASSCPAGRRRWRRPGSWRASTTPHAGERRWKAIARRVAYHGTTMGALSINGCTELRTPFEPLVPDVLHVSNTNRYHRPREETEEEFTAFLLDELEETIQPGGARHGRHGDHRAGSEQRRLVHAARGLSRGRARAL